MPLTVGAFICAPFSAAAPLTWTVEPASFPDGGDITGNFTFDATTGIYTSIALTTTDLETPSPGI